MALQFILCRFTIYSPLLAIQLRNYFLIKESVLTRFTLRAFVVVIREFGASTSIYGQVSLSYFCTREKN